MTIQTIDISNRYNELFASLNEGVDKTFSELSTEEINYIISLLAAETGGSGGGGITSSVSVTNFPSTQPISNTSLTSIDSKIPSLINSRLPVDVQALTVTVNNAQLEIANDIGNPIPVNGTVSLGTGTNLIGNIGNTSFSISGTLPAFNSTPTIKIDQSIPGTTNKVNIGTDGTVTINNFPNTQVISGSVNVNNFPSTQTISGNVGLNAGSNVIGTVAVNNFPSSQTVNGTVTANIGTGNLTGITNTVTIKADSAVNQVNLLKVDPSGVTSPVSVSTLPLPSGAAISAKQPALGIAGTPSTDVITVQGITNGIAIKVDGSSTTQPISGTIAVNNFPSVQAISGTVNLTSLPALATGTNTIGAISNTSFSSVQSGTWNLNNITGSITLPTGAATASNQTTEINSLATIATNTGNIPALGQALAASSVPVVLPAAQITALTPPSTVGISGSVAVTGTFYQATQPVSLASLPTLAAGTNAIGSITNTAFGISGTLPAFTLTPTFKIDQSVAGTSNQVSAVQNGTWNIGNITGTISLPTGASTSALQTTINTTLGTLATASAQTTGNSSLATIVTNTIGIATAANQVTMQASLSSIVTNTTGAATSALQTTGNNTLSTMSTSLTSILARLMPAGTDTNYVGTSVADCVKTSSGSLYSITAVNLNTATRYLQIFNQATVPTTGNVPVRVFTLFGSGGNALVGQDLIGGSGISLSTGVAWGVSTTPLTYTAGTTTDTIVSVRWV